MYVSAESGADATAAHTAALTNDVDFLMHPGDLAYGIGQTSIWNEWMSLIEPTSSKIPYMVTTGNHGAHTKGGEGEAENAQARRPAGEVERRRMTMHRTLPPYPPPSRVRLLRRGLWQ